MRGIIIVVSLIVFIGNAYCLTPQEILKRVDEIRSPADSFTFNLKVTVRKGTDESIAGFSVRVKDARKSLVLYKSPPSNKGRVLLMVGDNMWIYIPGTRNPMRISPQQQMMGDVSNADVARVVYSLDYEAESMEKDNMGDKKVLRLTLTPKTKGAAYKVIKLWVEKDSLKPLKGEFSALTGRPLKTVFYKGYKEILGKERPTIFEIHDAIKRSEISIMQYSDIRIEDTPDIYFQKTYMERVK